MGGWYVNNLAIAMVTIRSAIIRTCWLLLVEHIGVAVSLLLLLEHIGPEYQVTIYY